MTGCYKASPISICIGIPTSPPLMAMQLWQCKDWHQTKRACFIGMQPPARCAMLHQQPPGQRGLETPSQVSHLPGWPHRRTCPPHPQFCRHCHTSPPGKCHIQTVLPHTGDHSQTMDHHPTRGQGSLPLQKAHSHMH